MQYVRACILGRASGNIEGITIRREMKRLGIDVEYPDTTTHAIRKFYAVERYFEELDRGFDEISAWEIVQKELGHGDKFRLPLFRAYIQEPIENSIESAEQGNKRMTERRDLADLVEEVLYIEADDE